MDIKQYLQKEQASINRWLQRAVPAAGSGHARIYEAARYSLFAGGKRIRPILAMAVCRMLKGNIHAARAGGCAIELVHTYSLIHDDLPCMDDDDFRRGKPSSHKQFAEDIALLAGDALQAMAFEMIASRVKDPSRAAAMTRELASAAGPEGMVGGQLLDLEYEGRTDVSIDTLHDIHSRKTGAMLSAAVRMGVLAADCSRDESNALKRFGRHLGLLFQIVDDILDQTGDFSTMGKTLGKDAAAGKATFPALMGLEEACVYRDTVLKKALKSLAIFSERGTILRGLTHFICTRNH